MDETNEEMYEDLDLAVIANGIDESGRVDEALAWITFAIEYVKDISAAQAYPPFIYKNVDGFVTRLQLDWTGTTASSISDHRAVIMFDSDEGLVELHDHLVNA